MHLFRVYPVLGGRRFELAGTTIPYPLRYRSAEDALSYAHSRCKGEGSVTLKDSRGFPIFTERINPRDDGLRPAAPPTPAASTPKTQPPPPR